MPQMEDRLPIAFLPTPLQWLVLGGEYGCEIAVKRDDCTGLAGGGNKTRKLEYLLFDAKRKAEVEKKKLIVITAGGVQSNHCRQTAAACAKEGIECHLVLSKNVDGMDPIYFQTGNLQLNQLLGANIHFCGKVDRQTEMEKLANRFIEETEDCLPYIIPIGGSNAIGSLGYVNAMKETLQQIQEQNRSIEKIYLATSSYGTQAGLLVGSKWYKNEFEFIPKIIGVDVDGLVDGTPAEERIFQLCQSICEHLGLPLDLVLPEDVTVLCSFGGEGYGKATEEANSWIKRLARAEGILLDPVYSGKAFSGMMNTIKKGEKVLFLHTGGLPGIFAYPSLSDSSLNH